MLGPQTARTRISNPVSGVQCHFIHLPFISFPNANHTISFECAHAPIAVIEGDINWLPPYKGHKIIIKRF